MASEIVSVSFNGRKVRSSDRTEETLFETIFKLCFRRNRFEYFFTFPSINTSSKTTQQTEWILWAERALTWRRLSRTLFIKFNHFRVFLWFDPSRKGHPFFNHNHTQEGPPNNGNWNYISFGRNKTPLNVFFPPSLFSHRQGMCFRVKHPLVNADLLVIGEQHVQVFQRLPQEEWFHHVLGFGVQRGLDIPYGRVAMLYPCVLLNTLGKWEKGGKIFKWIWKQ